MRDKDIGLREVRGGVINQNISILIDICTIISYRNKHKHLLDQPQHQHYCKIIIYLSLQNTQSLLPASPSCIICFSFCSWKSEHRQFAGYIFLILPVSLENSGLTHAGSRVISLSLLTCVLLWNLVCGSDRVVGDSSYCEIVQCETPCRRSIVQCENSSDWMLPQIVMQCENNGDPTSLKIVQCELGIRVFSHLAHCFGTWHVSPLSSVRLGICEHGNRTQIRTKTIGPRSPERGGLGSLENELWSGSVVVRKQSDPTHQRTRLYDTV